MAELLAEHLRDVSTPYGLRCLPSGFLMLTVWGEVREGSALMERDAALSLYRAKRDRWLCSVASQQDIQLAAE